MEREKPKVGQIIYSLNVGNSARHCEQRLTEMEVTKVGRKYFNAKRTEGYGGNGVDFHISDWRQKTEYCAEHALYICPDDWERDKEARSLVKEMRGVFDIYGRAEEKIGLDKLRRIAAILREGQ